MDKTPIVAKTNPTGNRLVKLADVPLKDRIEALHRLMAYEGMTADEAQTFLALILDPGDISARIAA